MQNNCHNTPCADTRVLYCTCAFAYILLIYANILQGEDPDILEGGPQIKQMNQTYCKRETQIKKITQSTEKEGHKLNVFDNKSKY